MYRALVIGLGDRFRGPVRRLEELEPKPHPDASTGALSGFTLVDRAEAASNGRAFRDELRDRSLEHLSSLLEMGHAPPDEKPTLDLFVLADLGPNSVHGVLGDTVGELTAVISQHFEPMFPDFRSSNQRRVRLVIVCVLSEQSSEERLAGYDALRELWLESTESTDATDRTDILDRVYLLDTVTPTGIVPPETLVDNAENFVELVTCGGLRRTDPVCQLVEGGGDQFFGTVTVAHWSLDAEPLRERLVERLAREVAESLRRDVEEDAALDAKFADASLDDRALFESLLERIAETPRRVRTSSGVAAAVSLSGEYEQLITRLQERRDGITQKLDRLDRNSNDAETTARDDGESYAPDRFAASAAAGLVLTATMFAVSQAVLELSSSAGGVWSVLFGLVGAILTYVLTGVGGDGATPSVTADGNARDEEMRRLQRRHKRMEKLLDAARTAEERLDIMRSALDKLHSSVQAERTEAEPTEEESESLPLRVNVRAATVDDAFFETYLDFPDIDAASRSYGESLPAFTEWDDLDTIDPDGLRGFADGALLPVDGDVFRHRAVRDAADSHLDAFLDVWGDGLPLFVDLKSRAQYDPDGFHTAADDVLLAPTQLARSIENRGSSERLERGPDLERGDTLAIVRALVDVHPEVWPEPQPKD